MSEYEPWPRLSSPRAILATSPLDSENGSYELESFETTDPQPLPWDESGRFVWAFDAYIDTRKDFF